jgi:hypothetical protein
MCCRNCRRGRASRPRGLCWTCYYKPGVRERFPSTSKFAQHGVEDFIGTPALAPIPTAALPGTPDKVAVLQDRARCHLALWHPLDAPANLTAAAPAGSSSRRQSPAPVR